MIVPRYPLLLSVLVLLAATAAAAQPAGDPAKGERVFARCKACHTIEGGGPNRVGPNLHGVLGRPAASVADYSYSKAMKEAAEKGLVWTPETLDVYLQNPRKVVPGTKMAFAGLPRESDRADVIAYLAAQSK